MFYVFPEDTTGSLQAVAISEVAAIAASPASTLDSPEAKWTLTVELKGEGLGRTIGGLTEDEAKAALRDFVAAAQKASNK